MRKSLLLILVMLLAACSSKREPRENPLIAEAKRCATRGAEMTCARPILSVANLKASQAYYRDALGFKLDWEHGDPPGFASVSRGDFVLFMCEGCQGKGGAWSMTFMHDVDKYYAELKSRGAIVRQPPKDEAWGLREMQVADPDGNVIRFAASGDHDDD